jgi:hypothetical protein
MANDTISLSVSSDLVHIEYTVTDNNNLHEVATNITKGTTNVYTKSAHVDAKTYSFNEHFMPTGITELTQLSLKIDASDHNGNEDSKTVIFYVKP